MRISEFVRRRSGMWKEFEQLLDRGKQADPESVSLLYMDVIDDLAYAKAQYPSSIVCKYLNQLALRAHSMVYSMRRDRFGNVIRFWTTSGPEAMLAIRPDIVLSAIVLLLTIAVGVVGTLIDERFVRGILGNAYVDMTIRNIEAGNPLGVYGQEDVFPMFAMIAVNNVVVMLRLSVMGLLTLLVPVALIAYHGFMLGAFHTLFFRYGVLGESLAGVYVHGAMEISALIVSGAAGIHLGRSILFPATFTRVEAFRRGGLTAVRVAMAMLPFIVVAAFLESTVTRYAGTLPLLLNLAIIAATLFVTWWYVLVLPKSIKD